MSVTEIPRICLNMIVKDEEHCILETLGNVCKYIDYYIISDTGSTDDTKEIIEEFFEEKGIKGEIHDVPWKNFGYNRSKALELCSGKAEYAFVMDADDLVRGNLVLPEKMTADAYNFQFGGGVKYNRLQIFRVNEDKPLWRYKGVLHEHPEFIPDHNPTIEKLTGDYYIESRRLGARNKDMHKYLRDAKVLEEEYKKDQTNSRTVFYLAQSYFDANVFDKAKFYYKKRVEMPGNMEERFFAAYRMSQCTARMSQDPKELVAELIYCSHIHPLRVEPFYDIARIMNKSQNYREAFEFGKLGLSLEYHERFLFSQKVIYDFLLLKEVIEAAYNIKEYQECFNLCQILLQRSSVPDDIVSDTKNKSKLCKRKIDKGKYKHKPTIVCYSGYSSLYSDKPSYGSELAFKYLIKQLGDHYRIIVFSETSKTIGFVENAMSFPIHYYKHFKDNNKVDKLIISRYIAFFMMHEVTAKEVYIWMHDIELHTHVVFPKQGEPSVERIPFKGYNFMKNLDHKVTKYITLTDWHRKHVMKMYKLDPNKVEVIGNGLNVELFEEKVDRVPQRFIWTSAPDRNLDTLLDYFEDIHKEFPKAELVICRGKELFTEKQLEKVKERDYITHKEFLSNENTVKEIMKSDVWFYPSLWPETYCISALEAQMAGCICIATDYAALTETIGLRGLLIKDNYATASYKEKAMKYVRMALNGEMEHLRKKGKKWASEQSWKKVGQKWIKMLGK